MRIENPESQIENETGRWMTPDPLGGDVSNPQSLNRYAYVLNNPTSMIDPLGLSGFFWSGGCLYDGQSGGSGYQDWSVTTLIYCGGDVGGGNPCSIAGDGGASCQTMVDNAQSGWWGTFVSSFMTFAGGPDHKPTCAGAALSKIGEDLNPFTPGIEAAAPAARSLAFSRGMAKTTAAVDAYIEERGLIVPLRSSVVRKMILKGVEDAVAAGETADVAVQTLAVDKAAFISMLSTMGEARSGGCSAAFPVF